jgi:hypothetical protein
MTIMRGCPLECVPLPLVSNPSLILGPFPLILLYTAKIHIPTIDYNATQHQANPKDFGKSGMFNFFTYIHPYIHTYILYILYIFSDVKFGT